MPKIRHQPSTDKPASGGKKPTATAASKLVICLIIVLITTAAYWQVLNCGFIGFDDPQYVTNNVFVNRGLGWESVKWAISSFDWDNWHPLTWISHMADCQLYGLNPRGHHLTNLILHVANSLLLFLLLNRITGSAWRSALVAALFAVHPLHVESVAWVAERKDVLSTLFWLLTMYAYAHYAVQPGIVRYLLVAVAFGLGLMCKPMLVSLPVVLLLLDYWPLGRTNLKWRLLREKLPLLLMSAGSCAATFLAQRSGGAVAPLDALPLLARISNAIVSYAGYVLKMLWPVNLAVFYPRPLDGVPGWLVAGLFLALAAVTVLVIRARRRPYLPVGWLWYLITLVPVIGLVQVGDQAMADRYTYITLTGLFVIIAWGVPDLTAQIPSLRRLLPALATVVVGALAVCTWNQVAVWRDTRTLFDHAIAVTEDNYLAYHARGIDLAKQGIFEEAIADMSRAIEIKPNYAEAHSGLGAALVTVGQVDEGISHLQNALRLGFDTAETRCNLAIGYYQLRKIALAEQECLAALELDPSYPDAHNTIAAILAERGNLDEAISHLKSAIHFAPGYPDPYANLAKAYLFRGDYASAWREYHLFLRKGGEPDPRFAEELSRRMPDPGE